MAALTVTATDLRELDAVEGRRTSIKMDVAVTRGQVVYQKTNGNGALAIASAVATSLVVGIATAAAGIGEVVECLWLGKLVGIDLSGLNPGAVVYASAATAGAIDGAIITGTGNVVVPLGTVRVMTDVSATKYLQVDISQALAPVALA